MLVKPITNLLTYLPCVSVRSPTRHIMACTVVIRHIFRYIYTGCVWSLSAEWADKSDASLLYEIR
jgi:hypothetical protein